MATYLPLLEAACRCLRAHLNRGGQVPGHGVYSHRPVFIPFTISELGLQPYEPSRQQDRPRGGEGRPMGCSGASRISPAQRDWEENLWHLPERGWGLALGGLIDKAGFENLPSGRERGKGGGQESCHPALTSPLNFKVALPSGMLGRGGDLAQTLLSAVCCSPAQGRRADDECASQADSPLPGRVGTGLRQVLPRLLSQASPGQEPSRRMGATGGRQVVCVAELLLSA